MAGMEWVKLQTSMFENRKVKYLRSLENGDSLCLLFVMIITLAGRCGTCGELWVCSGLAYDANSIANALGFPQELIEYALEVFQKLQMLDFDGECYHVCGWDEYQAVEKLEQQREQARERKRKQRERKESTSENGNVTQNVTPMSRSCHANVTQNVTPMSRNVTLQSKSKSKSKKECVSKVNSLVALGEREQITDTPTLEPEEPNENEVEQYFQANNLKGDWERFYLQYAPVNWCDAHGNKIGNWKQMARRWSKNEQNQNASATDKVPVDDIKKELEHVTCELIALGDVPEPSGAAMTEAQANKYRFETRRRSLVNMLKERQKLCLA